MKRVIGPELSVGSKSHRRRFVIVGGLFGQSSRGLLRFPPTNSPGGEIDGDTLPDLSRDATGCVEVLLRVDLGYVKALVPEDRLCCFEPVPSPDLGGAGVPQLVRVDAVLRLPAAHLVSLFGGESCLPFGDGFEAGALAWSV